MMSAVRGSDSTASTIACCFTAALAAALEASCVAAECASGESTNGSATLNFVFEAYAPFDAYAPAPVGTFFSLFASAFAAQNCTAPPCCWLPLGDDSTRTTSAFCAVLKSPAAVE